MSIVAIFKTKYLKIAITAHSHVQNARSQIQKDFHTHKFIEIKPILIENSGDLIFNLICFIIFLDQICQTRLNIYSLSSQICQNEFKFL